MQLFKLVVTKNSIESADIKLIIYEEEQAKEVDNNNNNDFNNKNDEVFIEEDAFAEDLNLDSNSDSDNDSPTAAKEQPEVGHDITRIKEEKEKDTVTKDDIVMKCPVCNASHIGTNVHNCDICRFALRGSL